MLVPLDTVITLLILIRTSFSFSPIQYHHGRTSGLNYPRTTASSKKFAIHRSAHAHAHSISLLQTRYLKRSGDDEDDDDDDDANVIFGLFPNEIYEKDIVGPLSILLLSQFILFIGVGAVIPSIPLYGKEIGLSSASNGVVISAPAVSLLLASKFGGNLADVARKPAMIIGMAVIAVSDIGTAIAPSIIPLVVARLGLGLGRCISESGERGMLADLAGRVPNLRGSILAAQSVSIALGIAIGAPAGGYVVEEYGPRAAFVCVSAAALVALCMYSFLPETVRQCTTTTATTTKMENSANSKTSTSFIESIFISPSEAIKDINDDDGDPSSQLTDQTKSSDLGDWNKLLETRRWKALSLCQCGATFGFAAKIASVPILATSVFGNAAAAGALISACGLSGLIGGPFGGWLTDQTNAKSTAIWSGIFSATSLILLPFALNYQIFDLPSLDDVNNISMPLPFVTDYQLQGQPLFFTILVIGWSLGATAQGPALTALAQESAPDGAEATAMALPRAAGDGTYIIAPVVLGLVADYFGNSKYLGAECGVAGLAMLCGVFSLVVIDNEHFNQ